MRMKKILIAIGVIFLMSSCTSSRMVLSTEGYRDALDRAKENIRNNGYYQISEEQSETNTTVPGRLVEHKDNGHLVGVTQEMVNIKNVYETHLFVDSLGNEMWFRVALRHEGQHLLRVNLEGFQTSNYKDFERLCGNQSAIRREISMLKPDKEVKRFSLIKTVGAGALIAVGAVLFCGIFEVF
jgi:hypothetical protein